MASRSSGNHDSWHAFGEFHVKAIRLCKIVDRFVEKRASGAHEQIRTAAPHCEMGLWHGWANFNTQSVQTLSFSRFVASRSNAKRDSWHEFSEFHEKPSDFVKLLIDL